MNDQLYQILDKLQEELEILDQMEWWMREHTPTKEEVDVAVSQAKRVRRQSNLLVRELAKYRDNLQPKEGTR